MLKRTSMSINVSTGSFEPSTSSFNEVYCSGTAAKSTYDNFAGSRAFGVSTPYYRKQMRQGMLIPATSWTTFKTSGIFSGSRTYFATNLAGNNICNYTQSKPNINNWTFTPITGQAGLISHNVDWLLSFISPNLIDSVVTRAIVNLRSPKHDTLTWLAELKKTFEMFRNLGRSILQFLARHDAREIANMWLQGRYGWRQLILDCQSIEDALNHLSRKGKFWKSQSSTETSEQILYSGVNKLAENTLLCTTTGTITVSYRGIGRSSIKPPAFGGSPLVTLWEIVPFSFVIDWFINIGQKIAYLSTLTNRTALVSHYGVKIDAVTQSVTTLQNASRVNPGYHYTGNYASAVVTSTLILRESYTPPLIPSWSVHLDPFKVADIIALVIQALSRHKP